LLAPDMMPASSDPEAVIMGDKSPKNVDKAKKQKKQSKAAAAAKAATKK
jgi:hypothetical protein